ncbi:hypothetical protein ACFY1S_08440 [Micromonospora sp. NPDC000663]|uniref:hypothetical protein n=1 Tax=Micromonospora sp. NPDC000663 TaxID=3364218 RepID=UPI0036A61101
MRLLGVDIGGVIIEPADEDADTSFFGAHYLRTPPVDGAFDALATLEPAFDEVHLVSKCGEATERRTRQWLAHHDFPARTGIPAERVHFCRTRRDKAPIARRLGLTHFVDDKLEVLGYLDSVPHRYLFRPCPAQVAAYAALLPHVHRVESWPELTALLRAG